MKDTFIVIDNSLYMQNQDYTPKRFICEKESIYKIISDSFEARGDVQISIIPSSSKYPNNFVSPTNCKQRIINYLNNLELCDNFELTYAFEILRAFSQTKQDANIIVFLGTKPTNLDKEVYEEIAKFSNIKVILFGEAIDLDLKGNILRLETNKDFYMEVNRFLGTNQNDGDDELLKMVLEQSKKDY